MSYKKILNKTSNEQQLAPEKNIKNLSEKEYKEIFSEVREKVLKNHNDEIKELITDKEKNKEKLLGYIKAALPKYEEGIEEKLYQDIFCFAFIDELLKIKDLEEINANSWNDIEIITSQGFKKVDFKFQSPEHAINVTKAMMRVGGKVLDDSKPSLDSHIGKGLRLTATIAPVVDEDAGVAFSLRKIERGKINSKDLVEKYNSYSREEIDFLEDCLENGVSTIFGGATGSGKTADLQAVCLEIVRKGQKRFYTQEEDTRELDFRVEDEDGNVISRVIHTKTRPAENSGSHKLNVDSGFLLKKALRYHPDVIVPSEMRGGEAFIAQEAARTGHAVTSSVHVSSVVEAYKRILTLCQMADVNLSEDMLMEIIVDAFPICVFKKQLSEDKSRRCLRIFEAIGYDKIKKKIKGRILYRFEKTEVVENENGFVKVIGEHKKVNNISLKLAQKLYENGCPIEKVKKYNPEYDHTDGKDYIEDYIED